MCTNPRRTRTAGVGRLKFADFAIATFGYGSAAAVRRVQSCARTRPGADGYGASMRIQTKRDRGFRRMMTAESDDVDR